MEVQAFNHSPSCNCSNYPEPENFHVVWVQHGWLVKVRVSPCAKVAIVKVCSVWWRTSHLNTEMIGQRETDRERSDLEVQEFLPQKTLMTIFTTQVDRNTQHSHWGDFQLLHHSAFLTLVQKSAFQILQNRRRCKLLDHIYAYIAHIHSWSCHSINNTCSKQVKLMN